ncbi:MAG: ACT domain-containing protein [Candidatus Moranbacteria bacterium]|nr:ACT domain-containing protein [Candidatus Moranbacteria bacterium]
MQKKKKKRAIITVIGRDKVGIIAQVSQVMAENNINIEELNQTIIKKIFTMVMLVDLTQVSLSVAELSRKLNKLSGKINCEIHVHDEKIINAMHRL